MNSKKKPPAVHIPDVVPPDLSAFGAGTGTPAPAPPGPDAGSVRNRRRKASSHAFTVRLTDDLYRRLVRCSDNTGGMDYADIVRTALLEYFQKNGY